MAKSYTYQRKIYDSILRSKNMTLFPFFLHVFLFGAKYKSYFQMLIPSLIQRKLFQNYRVEINREYHF